MKAYKGKVLWVDLTHGTWSDESIPDSIYQKYLGGTGLGAWLLYRAIPAGADPLGPENVLGFLPGLLTGTGSLFTGRWMAVAKSPLTGTWGEANCGGNLAYAIKQCGYDGILFTGISPMPVYLYIDSHGPQLLDASHLWGQDAIDTEDTLLSAHAGSGGKKKPAIATIGLAGEKLSLISGIVNDRGRLAARSGLGAVMGSKRLKAVVLAGAQRVGPHDPLKTKLLSLKCKTDMMIPPRLVSTGLLQTFGWILGKIPLGLTQSGNLLGAILSKWGTIGTYQFSVGCGDTPFKNWAGTARDMPRVHQAIDPDRVQKSEKRKYHCRGCPLGCGGIVELNGTLKESHKPEYETIAGFTALLLNDDLDLVYELNEMLNRAGMDTISASASVAFAMECFEKGWITKEDTGGIELTWGNGTAIRQVVYQMINRQGFGAWLTDGSKNAARTLHSAAMGSAIQAGGQEIAYHDPRLDPGLALHASVDPSPGKHTNGGYLFYELYQLWKRVPTLPDPTLLYAKKSRFTTGNGHAESAVAVSNFTQFYNALGACYMAMLIGVDRVPIFEWANAITGWQLSPEAYLRIGQRIQTLRQMFNLRQGVDPRSLKISKRLTGDPPLEWGPNRGAGFDLDLLMRNYWQATGWEAETGIPTTETLQALDLLEIVQTTDEGAAG
jgi:aldehyde:ferredoxin oxidoreductase